MSRQIKQFLRLFFVAFSFFLTSCHFIGKKHVSKTEAVKREISSVHPNHFSENQHSSSYSILSQPVSKVVLFKNKKPVCAFSAVKNHAVVPSGFQISKKDDVQLRLPECNPSDTQLMSRIAQNPAFLDKEGKAQVAVLPALAVSALCVAGSVLGGVVAAVSAHHLEGLDSATSGLAALTASGILQQPVSRLELAGSSTQKWVRVSSGSLRGLGIAGVCGSSVFGLIMVYKSFNIRPF